MTRTTLVCVSVAGLLAVLALIKVSWPDGPPPIGFRLPALDIEAVDRLVIRRGEQSMTIGRDPAGKVKWLVTEPFVYEADKEAVERVLQAYREVVPMDLFVTDVPGEYARYGVSSEEGVTLEVYAGGTREVAIVIGKNAPGGSSYVRPVGSQEVYRARVSNRSWLERSAEDWREKRLFAIDAKNVRELEVEGAGRHYRFLRSERQWSSAIPAGLPLDFVCVDTMVQSFCTLRATDIPEGPEREGGFDRPFLTVRATLTEGTRVLVVGAEIDSGTRYAKRDGDPQLFAIRQSVLEALFLKDVNELRNKSIFDFDPESIVALGVVRGQDRTLLEKGDGGWKVVEPVGRMLAPGVIQTTMASLAAFRALEILSSDAGADLGFNHGFEVTIRLKSGRSQVIKIGAKAGEDRYYAARADGSMVFTLSSYHVEGFKRLLGGRAAPSPIRK